MSENNSGSDNLSSVTIGDFYKKLNERVSSYNARMLLRSVVVETGVDQEESVPLKTEDAKNICLQLIRRGGPAFQVGKALYQTLT